MATDTPILAALIVDLGRARDEATGRAEVLQRLVADLEALHEPDSNGDCPTCLAPAPCVTHLMVRGEITLTQAAAAVRDHQPIDLVAAEGAPRPPVPSLEALLAAPAPGLERFFDALLRDVDVRPDVSAA